MYICVLWLHFVGNFSDDPWEQNPDQGRVNLDTKNPVFQEVQKFARNLSGFATHSSA